MPNGVRITLTVGAIQRNIIKVNRIMAELDYYRRGPGRTNQRRFHNSNKSYFKQIIDRANTVDGVPCFKCRKMIQPYADCIAKYHHSNLAPVTIHYHSVCYDSLFH